jgi:hypothetical protein
LGTTSPLRFVMVTSNAFSSSTQTWPMDIAHDKQVQLMSSRRLHFLSLPFEIRHRIYEKVFESGCEDGRGCATILRLNKFIFGEAQAYLHGPLNANVLAVGGDRHHHELPFEPPITLGRSGTWRFDKYSRLEASLLPHIILQIGYCDLTVSANMCMRDWLDWKRKIDHRVQLGEDDVPEISKKERSAPMVWETNNFDIEITTARERKKPLYDYHLGRQMDKFCDMAKESTCLARIDVYLHCISSSGLSDAAFKPNFSHAHAPMTKLMGLVHLKTAIAIQAKPWDGTMGYDGHRRGHGVNETSTVEHFNEMRRQFVGQEASEDVDLRTG